MSDETAPVATPVGQMIRAVARRDNDAFVYWRGEVLKDDSAQASIYPVLWEVFRLAVILRFESLKHVNQVGPFVRRSRLLMWPRQGFSEDKAIQLIRVALRDDGLAKKRISTRDVIATRLQLVTYLVEDMNMTDEQLDWLVAEGEQRFANNPNPHPTRKQSWYGSLRRMIRTRLLRR
jgi:hypothetical protein